MEGNREKIDWNAAVEQLLAVLASIARSAQADADSPGSPISGSALSVLRSASSRPEPVEGIPQSSSLTAYRPTPAVQLARLVFGSERWRRWDHETRRRRVRDAVDLARKSLRQLRSNVIIRADRDGYWLESDPAGIALYAALRRRHGLQAMKAASNVKPNLAAAQGQTELFEVPS